MSFGANLIVGGDLDSVGRLRGGRLDYPFMPTKTNPYTKGLFLEVPGEVGVYSITYVPEFDIELVAVAVGASRYQPRDNWSLYVGDERKENCIFDTIYTKDLPEGIYLMAVKTVGAGTPIIFKFNNEGGQSKYVWINYQCLR